MTQGILQVLDRDELRGVLAHEISHVGNRDILISSVAAAVAMGITFVARMACWARSSAAGRRRRRRQPFGAARDGDPRADRRHVLQMALSRSREYEADASGAHLLHDGEPLARRSRRSRRTPSRCR